jgi:AcrR family transcriptional regulator
LSTGAAGKQKPDTCRTAGALETPRRRRRGPALEDALLRAAWDEVTDVGYANLTMEGVAARAGTSKAVIYRRWPTRVDLVIAAYRRHVGSIVDNIPDTGNLREDVLAVLRQLRQHYYDVGPDVIHGVISERQHIPSETAAILPGVMTTLLNRAAARGEIKLARITPRMAAVPGDLLRHQLLLAGEPVTDEVLVEVVDDIFLPMVTAR